MKINIVPTIKVPNWSCKGLGIADKYFDNCDYIKVDCSYKTKNGNLLYPHWYMLSSGSRSFFKTMTRKGTLIRLVPIVAFTVLEKENNNVR